MNPITLSAVLLSLITLGTLVIGLTGLRKALSLSPLQPEKKQKIFRTTILTLTCWMVLLGLLAQAQVFAPAGLPPRPILTVLVGLVVLTGLSFTRLFRIILGSTPLHWLIFFQAFRIAVELWFWQGSRSGVFPELMTFNGANHDIFAGLLALVAGPVVMKGGKVARITAVVYNLIGFALLVNTLAAAATSIPSPIQRHPFDERLLLLGQFPFIYLPAILVVLALGFHVLSLRQLYLRGKRQTEGVKRRVPLAQ